MQFCWNCGNKQVPGQTFGPQQPVQIVQAPVQSQPPQQYYQQQSYGVQGQPNPYQQTVTVTYGGTGHVGGMNQGQNMQMQQVKRQTIIPCAFCEGEGHHPMNFDQPCPICRGAAKVSVMEPFTPCQQCESTGKKFATMDQVCMACQGKGVIQL
jgi:DnaJ-class molecular chaperone